MASPAHEAAQLDALYTASALRQCDALATLTREAATDAVREAGCKALGKFASAFVAVDFAIAPLPQDHDRAHRGLRAGGSAVRGVCERGGAAGGPFPRWRGGAKSRTMQRTPAVVARAVGTANAALRALELLPGDAALQGDACHVLSDLLAFELPSEQDDGKRAGIVCYCGVLVGACDARARGQCRRAGARVCCAEQAGPESAAARGASRCVWAL
jgi:hypothetical protein